MIALPPRLDRKHRIFDWPEDTRKSAAKGKAAPVDKK